MTLLEVCDSPPLFCLNNHHIAVLVLGLEGDMSLRPSFITSSLFRNHILTLSWEGGLCPSVLPSWRYTKVNSDSMVPSGPTGHSK